jgi:hypothetical protein
MPAAAHANGKKPVLKPVRALSPKGGARLAPGNPGNSGGKPGRSGRKPEVYRDLCRELISSAVAVRSVEKILKNDKHPHFATIYKHLAEHAHGKPVQPLSGEDGGAVVVRIIREDPFVASD